jgi:pimeloyl-ACP methyl ester carboxylesterase
MGASVYKSQEGRTLLERRYRDILDSAGSARFTELFVDSSIGKTHVLRFGDSARPPLVMLHGSMSNSATWLGVASEFADFFSVYCLDLPGEPGLTDPVRPTLASEEPSRWLASALDSLGINACALLGMSLGGFYGLHFAVRHPRRVTALSMITACGLAPQRMSFLFKAVLCLMLGSAGQKRLNALVYHKATVPREAAAHQALIGAHFNPIVEPVPTFADEELQRLVMPVQYFGGDKDALLDSGKSARRLEALAPAAEVHVLPDTGHVILDRFAEVKAFLVRNAIRDTDEA